jgi:Na+/proline symporter
VGVGLWVWLGGTHIAVWSDVVEEFGMLLGPEETPVWVLLSAMFCLAV